MGIRNPRSLYRLFIEPRSGDEDNRRREYILNIFLSATIVMFAVMDGFVGYYSFRDGAAYHEISFLGFTAFFAFIVLLLWLSRKGFFAVAAYFFIAIFAVGASYAAFRWGVNLPAALLGYAIVILLASILVNARFGLLTFGIIVAFLLPLWHAERHGLVHPQPQKIRDVDGVVFAVMLGFVTVAAWLSNREIDKSLTRARKSEKALREERDLLEVKVGERTRELREAQLEKFDRLYPFAEFGEFALGLFHDVLSMWNALSVRAEQSGVPPKELAGLQRQIEQFRAAIRKQLHRNDNAMEPFSLVAGVEHAIRLISHQAKQNHIAIHFDYPADDSLNYFGNPSLFHRLVMNLVTNAIEAFDAGHEPSHGKCIEIRLRRDSDECVMQVEDNGSGISENILPKIFDLYFTTKDVGKGTGIGLATVKNIVEKNLHGMISVASIVGKGSVFTVRFPLTYEYHDGSSSDSQAEHSVHQERTG